MLELAQRLGLDLADTFAGHRELLADFLEGVIGVHPDAKAHAQHAFLARGEAGEDAGDGFLEVRLDRGIDGDDRVLVLDEIAEVAVFLVPDGDEDRWPGGYGIAGERAPEGWAAQLVWPFRTARAPVTPAQAGDSDRG